MGAVAYSCASKSLGYRTQTGKPLNEEQRGSRDEADDYGYAEENIGQAAVAIGSDTKALENNSFAGGHKSVASGKMSFAFGANNTTASGDYAIALGDQVIASDKSAFAAGKQSKATAQGAVAIGVQSEASNIDAFALGTNTTASGEYSVAIGHNAQSLAPNSVSLGLETVTSGVTEGQVVLGKYNSPMPDAMLVVGNGTGADPSSRSNAFLVYSNGYAVLNGRLHCSPGTSPGDAVTKSQVVLLAAQTLTTAQQQQVRTNIGVSGKTTPQGGTVFNDNSQTQASDLYTISMGRNTKATAQAAVAMGFEAEATGLGSFAGGNSSKAGATRAFSFGEHCQAVGARSVAMNNTCNTNAPDTAVFGFHNVIPDNSITGQFVIGKNNAYSNNAIKNAMFVVGNGSTEDGSNAFIIDTTGNAKAAGTHTSMGADYAEMFEWSDGNPEAEDRIGYAVALEGEQIRLAQPGDDILGIISGTAAVLGDTASMHWKDKYITDSFGRIIYDMVEEFDEVENPDTHEITKVSLGFFEHPRLNPNYNADEAYTPREQRQEWSKVGMIGKLYARDDGTCVIGGYATTGIDGVLTYSMERTNIKIMKRTDDNIVYVLKI